MESRLNALIVTKKVVHDDGTFEMQKAIQFSPEYEKKALDGVSDKIYNLLILARGL